MGHVTHRQNLLQPYYLDVARILPYEIVNWKNRGPLENDFLSQKEHFLSIAVSASHIYI